VEEVSGLGAAGRRKLAGFAELMQGLRNEAETLPLPELLQVVLERSGYMEALAREGPF
jgi:superfamily I DNA/RNA helicase